MIWIIGSVVFSLPENDIIEILELLKEKLERNKNDKDNKKK